jgi:predicted MFS family arabinose efflux permease
MLSGRLVDRFESRRIINVGLCVAIINFCALPWTSAYMVSAAIALTIWGLVGWGIIVPQQHRLVKIAPQVAPLLLALNNTATYGGLACSGVLGGLVLLFLDRQYLSIVGAGLIAIAFVLAEAAHLCTERKRIRDHAAANPRAGAI